jgi:hypothetical protein
MSGARQNATDLLRQVREKSWRRHMRKASRFIGLWSAFCLLTAFCLAQPAWGQTAAGQGPFAQVTKPLVPPKPAAASDLTPVSVKNGIVRRKMGRDGVAPLRIETPAPEDYVLKLVNAHNGSEELLIYVGRNSQYETKVPLGTYTIHGASGTTWYGGQRLFGPGTSYFRLVQNNGNDQFTFRRSGNQVNGYVIRLIQQIAGNLDTPRISAEDF